MVRLKKRVTFDSQLPATPCTPQMRERVEDIAKLHNMSLADVQRSAMRFFLAEYDSNPSNESAIAVGADEE